MVCSCCFDLKRHPRSVFYNLREANTRPSGDYDALVVRPCNAAATRARSPGPAGRTAASPAAARTAASARPAGRARRRRGPRPGARRAGTEACRRRPRTRAGEPPSSQAHPLQPRPCARASPHRPAPGRPISSAGPGDGPGCRALLARRLAMSARAHGKAEPQAGQAHRPCRTSAAPPCRGGGSAHSVSSRNRRRPRRRRAARRLRRQRPQRRGRQRRPSGLLGLTTTRAKRASAADRRTRTSAPASRQAVS